MEVLAKSMYVVRQAHHERKKVNKFNTATVRLELVAHRYTQVYKMHVIPAGIAGIQATWKYLSSPSMALDTRFPAGMTSYLDICV